MPFIGRNVRRIRLEKKLKQHELAKLVGYSDSAMISRIEHGKANVTDQQVEALAKALEVDPSELLDLPKTLTSQELGTIMQKIDSAISELYTLQLALGLDSILEKRTRLWEAYDNSSKETQNIVDKILDVGQEE